MLYDEEMMLKALELAKKAYDMGECPVGAIVADKNGKIIGQGYNRRETDRSPTAHAEIIAIEEAAKTLQSWRLSDCTLYVTLEPCPMCMGAMLNARIKKVYFGAYEAKGRSMTEELANSNLVNHRIEVEGGIMQEECAEVLSSFFAGMREKTKKCEELKSEK